MNEQSRTMALVRMMPNGHGEQELYTLVYKMSLLFMVFCMQLVLFRVLPASSKLLWWADDFYFHVKIRMT